MILNWVEGFEITVHIERSCMYPFMTLPDNTEIVHSNMLDDGRVKSSFPSAGSFSSDR